MKSLALVLFGFVALVVSSNASALMATSYGFGCITSNTPGNCAAETAFSFTAEEVLAGEVTFTLFHADTMTDTGEITEVYFDGSDNLGSYISSNPEWNENVSPPQLPSQNTANPAFVTDFALDSDFTGQTPDAPLVPGGSLEIVFALLAMTSFSDVVDAIEDGSLRLGFHVRSINLGSGDGGESFVSVSAVPVPAAVWLMGTGLIGLIGFGRRRRSM
ncbi:MAG: hypothetical protein ACI85N_001837 [Gammaproteobacteria bacterium]|jgi:hypothetical protein